MAAPDRSLPVAVFDSGVGGLTVLHECLVSLPHEDFLYLGDTARFPYGDRTADELLGFARELAGILLERGAKLLVVACNSATAAALPALREELESRVPVVGVVTPESRLAAAATVNGRVGLIATPATVGERRIRPRARRGGAGRRAARRRIRRAGAADPGGRGGGRARGELRGGPVSPAQAGGRRHRDPRLHALPARSSGAPARAWPRGFDRQFGRGDRVGGGVAGCGTRASHRTRTGAATTASLRPATPRNSGVSALAFSSCPIADVEHVEVHRARRAA